MRFATDAMAGRPGAACQAYRAVADPLAAAYALATRRRNRRYEAAGGTDLGGWTVSVGNLTAGGTGKTPVVRRVAEHLHASGRRPAVLTRGYRGGDEARELADLFRLGGFDVPVVVDPDRVAGAASAEGADCFVLDDGLQHRRARRDVDLVLVDATNPLGHGRTLPAGLLREPADGLARADAVLLTRSDQVPDEALAALRAVVASLTAAPPFTARHVIGHLLDEHDVPHEPTQYNAACGLGNPQAFFASLAARLPEATCQRTRAFADHHGYRAGDVADLQNLPLIVTGKDWVKLTDRTNVLRAELRVQIDDEAALMNLVGPRTARATPPRGTA